MNTQELVERLLRLATDFYAGGEANATIGAAVFRLSEMDAENKRLREALDEVARPMFHMRKRAEASGQRLSDMAYNIAHSLDHVQAIARAALEQQQKGEGL